MPITMPAQYRQGDILLCAVDSIPAGATPVRCDGDRVVVAEGELSGHAHAFLTGVELYRNKARRQFFLAVSEPGALLRHEEHGSILVRPGHYQILRQREWAPRSSFLRPD